MVKIKIPVIKRVNPPIFEIKFIFFLKFFEKAKNFNRNMNLISKIGGIILLVTGILILTNQLQVIGFYLIEIFPFMQKFG